MTGREKVAVTLRLDAELHEDLALIAQCDRQHMSDTIRVALASWVEQRRQDPAVQREIQVIAMRLRRLAALGGES